MCSVNFSAKGWTTVLSCGNIKSVWSGLIFTGTLPDSSNAYGYQGCVEHAGKTRTPVAFSRHLFDAFVSRLNGGNIPVGKKTSTRCLKDASPRQVRHLGDVQKMS